MKNMQAVVVRWMTRQLKNSGWTAERWAREAGLSPTTVTRAMSSAYGSVSSVPTLHALARALGLPSVVDYLDTQGNNAKYFPMMKIILDEMLPVFSCELTDEQLTDLSHAIGHAMVTATERPEVCRDPDMARVVARAAKSALLKHL